MAKQKESATKAEGQADAISYTDEQGNFSYCDLPIVPPRELPSEVNPDRAELIIIFGSKWVSGTVLRYYFFDKSTDGRNVVLLNGTTQWRTWTTKDAEKDVVRKAFKVWTDLGIGISFKEVATRDEAEIRIGFMRGDGAWSYLGRDIINIVPGPDERTMNFGWDLTRDASEIDTAVHEIGHTLGFPHEHQNPMAGIVWNEEVVYATLAQPPNSWDRNKTFHNIIRKIAPDTVQGSSWDPDSIMEYPFPPGLIKEPAQYGLQGVNPPGGLSARDKTWVKTFYPPLTPAQDVKLEVGVSVKLALGAGEQRSFRIEPDATRDYQLQTFGVSDTVIVLFEEVNGELRYLAGDDDSGEEYNAHIAAKLRMGQKYVLRIRLYYTNKIGDTAVMLW